MTFVLVHGGGFAGSCWDELIPLLDGAAVAVDLPGRGSNPGNLDTLTISDSVAAVTHEIVSRDLSEVTLVGHSMAGITLPGVVERVPTRLRRLVFVSCSIPPQGAAVIDVLGDLSPSASAIAERIGDGIIDSQRTVHPDLARAMFCNNMDAAQIASTLARLVPEALPVLFEPVDLTGLRPPIPRTYVRLIRDASITLDVQDQMIRNLGAADVVDLDAGHMAMITQPDKLASILNGL